MRATLRAPPAKWAVKGFFPAGERSEPRSRTARRAPADRSPRRIATWAASGVAVPLAFFGTFFRFERKYCPPSGRQPPRPRRSRRVNPPGGGRRFAPAGAPKFFPLALWKPSSTESRRETHKTASPNSRRSRRAKPLTDFFTAKLAYTAACRGLSARPLYPFGPSQFVATKGLRLRSHGLFPRGKPLAHRSPLMEKFVSPIPFSPKEVFPP